MKSLICYNIFNQEITYLEIIEKEKIDINSFLNFIKSSWHNGDVILCLDIDYREKTIYELKCLCRENLLPIIEKEINPFGG